MIFQHTLEQVLDGTKTQTRRIVKEWDYFVNYASSNCNLTGGYTAVFNSNKRLRFRSYATYSVQGGRGQKGVARIEITSIAYKNVRSFTDEEIKAEGFASRKEFFDVWCSMHDPKIATLPNRDVLMETAPQYFYQAWVINFNLLQGYPDLLKVISHA